MKELLPNLDIKPHLRPVYEKLVDYYLAHMPVSLYQNYYELAANSNVSATVWEQFLEIREVEAWINAKVAKLTEYNARSALNKLANGSLSANEVAALKELISKSKLIQENQNQRPTVILTYIPMRSSDEAPDFSSPDAPEMQQV